MKRIREKGKNNQGYCNKNKYYKATKGLCGFITAMLCISMIGSPIAYAEEADDCEDDADAVVIEVSEPIDVEGDNYGYIPMDFQVPSLEGGYESSVDEYSGLNGATSIPSSYDSRIADNSLGTKVSPVKNQGSYGTCWAFAAISAAESDAIIDGRYSSTEMPDYSELQLAYYTYNRAVDPLGGTTGDKVVVADGIDYRKVGGNGYFSTMAMASWIAPADENIMPYEHVGSYAAGSVVDTDLDYEANIAHLQNAYWVSIDDVDSVKKLIMERGSVDTSIYYDNTYLKKVTDANNVTDYYFYNAEMDTQNHEISLVGYI